MYTPKTHEPHMVDYSRHLLSCRFVYCNRAIPTPQWQEPCYYRIPDSLHSRYRRLGYLEVTLLCWPITKVANLSRMAPDPQKLGAEPTGLEPATSAVTGQRSNQLS
jgi:hypothetical protein